MAESDDVITQEQHDSVDLDNISDELLIKVAEHIAMYIDEWNVYLSEDYIQGVICDGYDVVLGYYNFPKYNHE